MQKPHLLNKYTTIKDKILLVLKGLAMGTANKVPGVSGGIVAFVAGFYEEFIYSLQRFNRKGFKLLFSGHFNSFYNHVNGRFLSLLFLGMIISYFSISKLLDYLIIHYELYVWSVFFGMIIGSWCTHYHFLNPILKKILPQEITIIESGPAIARQTATILENNNLLSTINASGNHTFFTNGSRNVMASLMGWEKTAIQKLD